MDQNFGHLLISIEVGIDMAANDLDIKSLLSLTGKAGMRISWRMVKCFDELYPVEEDDPLWKWMYPVEEKKRRRNFVGRRRGPLSERFVIICSATTWTCIAV
ncbi:hypothetical protein L1049_000820 [Liquidambar formosana]|uniref:Uncharacterized protein n=1 Tax=Liquidambar formosana TaxID=63359 RepID=A0AAP0R3F9_LIQFO